jgi:signal transduction histidine kinase
VSVRPRSLLVFAGLCAAATGAVAVLQRLQFTYVNGSLKIALETTATLAALVTSYLLLGRVQRTRALHELVLTCGLTVLAFSNFVFATLAAVGSPKSQDVIWEPLIGTAASATLIAISSMLPRRQTSLSPQGARRIVFGVATSFVVLMLVVIADPRGFLPHAIYAGAPTAASEEGIAGHPILVIVQSLLAIAYATAAFGFTRLSHQTKDDLSRWLAVACIFGATARLNYIAYPSLERTSLYSGDLFRLGFYIALLIGAAREIASYWASNVEAAQLEERRRIARDLHDGLAQEIAFIGRNAILLRDETPDPELVDRIAAAAERARLESRSVIKALTARLDQPLDRALVAAAQEAEIRYGASVSVKTPQLVIVPPARREALLRIATEAIANAARHSGTSEVRVELERLDNATLLRITDRGRGFDLSAGRSKTGFGLISMRERAEAIGGRFEIQSRPGWGTQVEVVI